MKHLLFFLASFQLIISLRAQEVIPLYKGEIPLSRPGPNSEESFLGSDGRERIRKVSIPALTAFLPPEQKSSGTAVIICPGGGYQHLPVVGEGYEEKWTDWLKTWLKQQHFKINYASRMLLRAAQA